MKWAIRWFAFCLAMTLATGEAQIVTFDPTPSTNFGGLAGSERFTVGNVYVESFWGSGTGSGGGSFTSAHFHTFADGIGSGNVENQHFNGATELQGFFIQLVDGSAFNVNSLDFRVTGTSSISGYSSADVNVLLATTFNPTHTVAADFTEFSVGTISGSYTTLPVTGFTGVTRLYISSSASVSFDNISITAVPEPSTWLLLSVSGIAAFATYRHTRRKPLVAATPASA